MRSKLHIHQIIYLFSYADQPTSNTIIESRMSQSRKAEKQVVSRDFAPEVIFIKILKFIKYPLMLQLIQSKARRPILIAPKAAIPSRTTTKWEGEGEQCSVEQ